MLDPIGDKTVDEENPLSFTVTASDPDSDPVTLSVSDLPAGASFNPATGQFSWTPGEAQQGTYSVTFTAADDGTPALSDSETITITVNEVNDAPVADDFSVTTTTTSITINVLVHASDVDYGDTLVVSAVSNGTYGSVTNNLDGTVTYTLTTFFSGADTFTYTVRDSHGVTATATVTVNVQVPLDDGFDLVRSQIGGLPLNSGEQNSLASKLDAALKSLSKGNDNAAVNQLNAFINQIWALKKSGRLSDATAEWLVFEANQLIDLIS